jgi:hypothetical protein
MAVVVVVMIDAHETEDVIPAGAGRGREGQGGAGRGREGQGGDVY